MRERLCTLGCWSAKPRLGAAAYNTTRGKFASRPSTFCDGNCARARRASDFLCRPRGPKKKPHSRCPPSLLTAACSRSGLHSRGRQKSGRALSVHDFLLHEQAVLGVDTGGLVRSNERPNHHQRSRHSHGAAQWSASPHQRLLGCSDSTCGHT